MSRARNGFAAALLTALVGSAADAAVLTFTLGDEDCFGFGTSCEDGTAVGDGLTTFDNATAADAAGMDAFGDLGVLAFTFSLDLTGFDATAAAVTARVLGLDLRADAPSNGGTLGDEFEGARFQINGTDIGTYFYIGAPGAPTANIVASPSFAIDPSLLLTGANTVTIRPEDDFARFGVYDSYAVDFVRLSITTAPPPPPPPPSDIPLPAGVFLLAASLGMLLAAHRIQS